MVGFELRLEDTYWSKGFFNVPVDFERFLSRDDGPVDIYLGDAATPTAGRMSRSAQQNATPRVFGNKLLRDFFQTHYKRGDSVFVEFISPRSMRIGGIAVRAPHAAVAASGSVQTTPTLVRAASAKVPAGTLTPLLSVDDLAELRRKLMSLLNKLEGQNRIQSEGIRKRISRLSQVGGPIPREIAALMTTITEMRNSAEYESKVLSTSECAVVRHAWQAIQDWAQSRE